MKRIELKVGQDHVESLAKVRNPLIAIEEAVWNSLDADATRVEIRLHFNELYGLQSITIKDNGTGISVVEGEQAFGNLGESAKLRIKNTATGRMMHGKNGKGRFRAFGVGRTVTWRSRYQGVGEVKEFKIKGFRSSLKQFEFGDEEPAAGSESGVELTIGDIDQNFPSLTNPESAALELSRRLALYLKQYPGIEICYEGHRVDPKKLEAHTEQYPLVLTDKTGKEVSAELVVIEWKSPTERALYFCDTNGFALEERSPGIQAPGYHFTAYLKSSLVPELVEENAFALDTMHSVVDGMLQTAKDTLRKHFRAREASRSKDLVRQWQEEEVYPYDTTKKDPVSTVEREVFNVCAIKVHEYLPNFEKADAKSKTLTFRLLKQALETNPESLQTILRQVLELPQEQQDDLAGLLCRTRLAAIINAAKTVTDRLDLIASLDPLLFGDMKETLLERKQLHRILVEELWLFGEQYSLGVDDESLKNVLKKHIAILERDDITTTDVGQVKDIEGKDRVVDLMLYQKYPQFIPDTFEHLVIELKRPTCKLGQKELGQIENYAFSVAADERFDKAKTKWKFLLIGNDLDSFADHKCRVQGKEFGHIYASDDGAVNIYVIKWATVISQAKWRYEFFRKELELDATSVDGLAYLRSKYSQYLPDSNAKDAGDEEAKRSDS